MLEPTAQEPTGPEQRPEPLPLALAQEPLARALPLAAMVVESDCPYLTPQPFRGRRNEPGYVVRTVQEVAELRGCTAEEVASATAENAARLFGIALSS